MAPGQPDDNIFIVVTKFVGSMYGTRYMTPCWHM